jgi:hypothetical protein
MEGLSAKDAVEHWNSRTPDAQPSSTDEVERVEPRPNFAEFSQALLIAAGIYTDVELAFWLTAPQPLLAMWTPIQLLTRGEAPQLLQVMQQLEDGVYV